MSSCNQTKLKTYQCRSIFRCYFISSQSPTIKSNRTKYDSESVGFNNAGEVQHQNLQQKLISHELVIFFNGNNACIGSGIVG